MPHSKQKIKNSKKATAAIRGLQVLLNKNSKLQIIWPAFKFTSSLLQDVFKDVLVWLATNHYISGKYSFAFLTSFLHAFF